MNFRRWLVIRAGQSLPFFFGCFALCSVLVLVASLVIGFTPQNSVIFLVNAETNKLTYQATGRRISEIPVQNVLVIADNDRVLNTSIPASALPKTAFCYEGTIIPAKGTLVEIGIREGRQQIQFSGADDAPYTVRLSRELGDFELEDQLPHQAEDALTLDGGFKGFLPLNGRVTATFQDACVDRDDKFDGTPFATRIQPISIEGSGSIGRKVDITPDGNEVFDPENAFFSGTIDLLGRATFCAAWFQRQFCDSTYRLPSDQIEIQIGAALRGDDPAAQMNGFAYYDDGLFKVSASIQSKELKIFAPSAAQITQGSTISFGVSTIERILADPFIGSTLPILLWLFGIMMAILQIEVHEGLEEQVTTQGGNSEKDEPEDTQPNPSREDDDGSGCDPAERAPD